MNLVCLNGGGSIIESWKVAYLSLLICIIVIGRANKRKDIYTLVQLMAC